MLWGGTRWSYWRDWKAVSAAQLCCTGLYVQARPQRCEVTPPQILTNHHCLKQWGPWTHTHAVPHPLHCVWESPATGVEVWILTPAQNNKQFLLFGFFNPADAFCTWLRDRVCFESSDFSRIHFLTLKTLVRERDDIIRKCEEATHCDNKTMIYMWIEEDAVTLSSYSHYIYFKHMMMFQYCFQKIHKIYDNHTTKLNLVFSFSSVLYVNTWSDIIN